jgi:hypothetical protein
MDGRQGPGHVTHRRRSESALPHRAIYGNRRMRVVLCAGRADSWNVRCPCDADAAWRVAERSSPDGTDEVEVADRRDLARADRDHTIEHALT